MNAETPENPETPPNAEDVIEGAEAETTGEAEASEVAAAAAPPAPTGPPPAAARTPEQRQADRDAARRAKAVARRRRRLQEREKARATRGPLAANVPPVERPTGSAKVRQGVVVSDKADKTITVRVDVARRHRRYEKIVRSSVTLHAHDEANDAHAGDTVRIVESRPLSATKRWRLVDVLERAR
jgi:small subunit ribosomal protein S17